MNDESLVLVFRGVSLFHSGGHRGKLGIGSLSRDAGPQPPNQDQDIIVARRERAADALKIVGPSNRAGSEACTLRD